MLGRAHTVLAALLIAAIPLVPFGLWVYAKAASVGREPSVSNNAKLLSSLPRLPGARRTGVHIYPVYRWDLEGSLVPVAAYRTELWLKLPRPVRIDTILVRYAHALRGWQMDATDGSATFTRGRVTVIVDTIVTHAHQTRVGGYGLYVSQ